MDAERESIASTDNSYTGLESFNPPPPPPLLNLCQDEIFDELPRPLPAIHRPALEALQSDCQLAFSWAKTYTLSLVRKKIESGELDPDDSLALDTYRAKVLTTIFKTKATWLAIGQETNITPLPIDILQSDFEPKELVRYLDEISPPAPSEARRVIEGWGAQIAKHKASNNGFQESRFGASRVVYRFDDVLSRVTAQFWMYDLRVKISFDQSPTGIVDKCTSGFGKKTTRLKVEPNFSAYGYLFDQRTFSIVRGEIEKAQREVGSLGFNDI